jgi:hypothetical protein
MGTSWRRKSTKEAIIGNIGPLVAQSNPASESFLKSVSFSLGDYRAGKSFEEPDKAAVAGVVPMLSCGINLPNVSSSAMNYHATKVESIGGI